MSGGTLAENNAETSRWRLLRHTPLRDVLRGRLSGRLDIDRVVVDAELPASLGDVVRETVRRTRLSRIEKADVSRELAAHFRDGLDAGAAIGELMGSFGEPRASARLIRRAKLRCRSAPMKALSVAIRGTLVLFAFVVLVALTLTIRLYSGKPTLTHNYVAEMNAPIRAIPEQDRAWPLYREAYLATAKWPEIDQRHFHPGSEHWPELAAFVERQADVLRLYREAAAKPHLGRPSDTIGDPEVYARHGGIPGLAGRAKLGPAEDNPMVISIVLPQLQVLREAARLLAIDARAAAIAGDGARTFEDMQAMLGIVEHAAETPTLISDLVSLAVLSLETEVIGAILADQPDLLTREQLVDLSHRLSASRGGGVFRVRIESERKLFEDIVQRIYTDDGDGDGHMVAKGADLVSSIFPGDFSFTEVPSVARVILADRRETMEIYDRLMSAAEAEALIPLWERTESAGLEREYARYCSRPLTRVRYLLISLLTPSLSRANAQGEVATLRRDAALAAIACELYRRDAGDWPESLSEVTPRYLPAVPVDRFDGEPLRYRLVDGAPLIYSVGADCNDDGGKIPDGDNARGWVARWRAPPERDALVADGSPEIPDADWVLWPRVGD